MTTLSKRAEAIGALSAAIRGGREFGVADAVDAVIAAAVAAVAAVEAENSPIVIDRLELRPHRVAPAADAPERIAVQQSQSGHAVKVSDRAEAVRDETLVRYVRHDLYDRLEKQRDELANKLQDAEHTLLALEQDEIERMAEMTRELEAWRDRAFDAGGGHIDLDEKP